MELEYPFMLILLVFVPVLIILFWLAKRYNQEMRQRFGDWAVFQQLIPNFAPKRSPLKFGLVLGAYILLVIALANPRMGSRTRKIKREGVDVYIALDISKSMWAKDVTPRNIDRLEKARLFSLKLIEELRGERVGLIFFAGEAFMKMPLTLDYSAPLLFLNDDIEHDELMPGTALNEVIELAAKSIANKEDETKKRQVALVILTDGEDHDQKGVDAARAAKVNGVRTYTIAVGSQQGANIPLTREDKPGFHSDKNGQVVSSAVNKVWLKEVADAGAGRFFDIEDGNSIITSLHNSLSKLDKEEFNDQQFDEYESYYQYFVFLALLLLGAEFIISYRKKITEKNEVVAAKPLNLLELEDQEVLKEEKVRL